MAIVSLLSGYKTYLAAVGLAGLSVYQVTQSQYVPAFQSFMAALATIGLRHAITKQSV